MLYLQLVWTSSTTNLDNILIALLIARWLIYDDIDPYGQLQWLVKVLLDAEENDEVVHILSHVPNGEDDCLHNWSREYSKIINR